MAVLLDTTDCIVGAGPDRVILRSQIQPNENENIPPWYIPLHQYMGCEWFAVEYYGSSFNKDSPALVHYSKETGNYTIQ